MFHYQYLYILYFIALIKRFEHYMYPRYWKINKKFNIENKIVIPKKDSYIIFHPTSFAEFFSLCFFFSLIERFPRNRIIPSEYYITSGSCVSRRKFVPAQKWLFAQFSTSLVFISKTSNFPEKSRRRMCVLRYGGKALCKRVENVAQTYEKKIILYLNDLRSTSG